MYLSSNGGIILAMWLATLSCQTSTIWAFSSRTAITRMTKSSLLLPTSKRAAVATSQAMVTGVPKKALLATDAATENSVAVNDDDSNTGTNNESGGSRTSREHFSLEVKTIVSETDMVLSHLKSRRSSVEVLEAARTIASLRSQQVGLIQKRDDLLNKRWVSEGKRNRNEITVLKEDNMRKRINRTSSYWGVVDYTFTSTSFQPPSPVTVSSSSTLFL